MLYGNCDEFEKPIDLILKGIEQMEIKDKELNKEVDCLHKTLMDKLNEKIILEMKIEKWKKVAETFRFKRK